jgi:arabinan endo-1,5-alpha-L-arabinosidase
MAWSSGRRIVAFLVVMVVIASVIRLALDRPPPTDLGEPVQGDTALRDPHIAFEDGVYYLFSTGPEIPVRRSTDGREWEEVGVVFSFGLPDWTQSIAPGRRAVWAPHVAHFEGRWHLYYSVSTFGTWTSAIGLATSPTLDPDHPAYEWADQGIVVGSEHNDTAAKLRSGGVEAWNAIDPWIVQEDGDRWLVWGSSAGGIYMRKVDPATGLLDDAPVLRLARRQPHHQRIEAANLVERDGTWYLFSSWDLCCQGVDSTYNIRVGRSDELTGTYTDQHDRPLLDGGGSLVLGAYDNVIGPGHSGVIREGDDWFLVHHFYNGDRGGLASLSIRPLLWTSDGWPVAADPGFVPAGDDVSVETVAGSWQVAGYESEDPEILYEPVRFDLREDGSVGQDAGHWTYDDGVVHITARPDCDGSLRTYELFVDDPTLQMYGRTGDGAALRVHRLEPSDDPAPAC